jgi:hypothetical protein
MKLIFPVILALMLVALSTYAGPDYYNHHKQPFSGSSNRVFTPVSKLEQQELSKTSQPSSVVGDPKLVKRTSWVKINAAALDALRTYAIDILEQASDSSDFNVHAYKNYEGDNLSVIVKNAHDFPLDINFNFFEDIQFADLYLSKITKAMTKEGEIYYSLNVVRHNTSSPAIFMILRDKLVIYTRIEQFNITVEQVNKTNGRIYLQEMPRLIEG